MTGFSKRWKEDRDEEWELWVMWPGQASFVAVRMQKVKNRLYSWKDVRPRIDRSAPGGVYKGSLEAAKKAAEDSFELAHTEMLLGVQFPIWNYYA